MQGSQEGKRAKLWGPRAHFGANISMKIAVLSTRAHIISFSQKNFDKNTIQKAYNLPTLNFQRN